MGKLIRLIRIANGQSVKEDATVFFCSPNERAELQVYEGRLRYWDTWLRLLFREGESMGIKVDADRVFATREEADLSLTPRPPRVEGVRLS